MPHFLFRYTEIAQYLSLLYSIHLNYEDSLLVKQLTDNTLESKYFIFKDNSILNSYAYCINSEPICYAFTIDQIERWLRENKNIHFIIHFDINKITYKIIVNENIIDENSEFFIPEIMKNPIHFEPNNIFFRGETHVYENLDDAKYDAIHLALKYLTLPKNEYHEYYGKYVKNDK